MSEVSSGAEGSGASFVRADLHVHLYPDSEQDPQPDIKACLDAAINNEIGVLAITDHNSAAFVRQAIDAASGTDLLVLPSIEISTHEGHLLALFAPENVATLETFATAENLKLKDLSATEKRSSRSMVELVEEIGERGGLAIPAHIDAPNGAAEKLSGAQWEELLKNPALAGLEFANKDALSSWFTEDDPDASRVAAWQSRNAVPELRERGLARLMSSDAHGPDQVGRDRGSRTLTRLRLDDRNFAAVRNAIVDAPKARCKAEVALPPTYPRVIAAAFEGGFLDGTKIDFSGNLNCFIGGRGSGKSTALLSIRAALGGNTSPDDDVDNPARMPEKTTVQFIDAAGSVRTAVRERGGDPRDLDGTPIHLRLADLGQEESGRLSRGYKDDPIPLLEFLDGFVVKHKFEEKEAELLAALRDNENELQKTKDAAADVKKFEKQQAELEASLKAAKEGKLDEMAEWARILATQVPLIDAIETQLETSVDLGDEGDRRSLEELAGQFDVDLSAKGVAEYVDGEAGVRAALEAFEKRRDEIATKAAEELKTASATAETSVARWKSEQAKLQGRFNDKQKELEGKGLRVEAGAVKQIADRLQVVKKSLIDLRVREKAFKDSAKARKGLVADLHANRENLLELRKKTLKRVAREANSYASGLLIHVHFDRSGIDDEWTSWLSDLFGFRKPRVNRLAEQISPRDFAEKLKTTSGVEELRGLKDQNGEAFFGSISLEDARTWERIFELEMMRLPDRPCISVQRVGETQQLSFDRLSAGQQHSVLLGLLLCAERTDPLIIDQPEDHLDGQYIAGTVVRHLEAAKERRQVIIATHSANLTVLGDAELVLPMTVDQGEGRVVDRGAVDRPETRERICDLLEGGIDAYKRRGRRYGLSFKEE